MAQAALTNAVAIDLDGALGDTRGLWRAFLEDVARRFRSIAELDPASLPEDRGAAAAELDRWAAHGVGDWRAALERFAEDHAPVYLRPSAGAGASLRALAGAGSRLGVFTDAPEELARVAETITGDPKLSALPIIALSSVVSPAAIERGRQAGFHDYVAKFDRPGLIAALKEQTADVKQAA